MREQFIIISTILLVLLSPTFAYYISGVNNSASFNYTYANLGWVNNSPICTPLNGLCNSSSTGGSGYNTSDNNWIYNGSSGLTANQTTLNATYQIKITNNCTGDEYPQGLYSNGTPICHTPTDTNTMYSASGLLLQLGSTTFSVKEGNMTNGGICMYNSTIGLWCNSTVSFVDTNCNTTNSCPTIVYSNNGSWVKLNQYTYNNLSITDITSAIGNATALDNASIIRSGNTSWIKANQYTYNNLSITDISSALGNATALDNVTIIRSGNVSWIKLNQYTYNNLSLSDIISAIGNATAVNVSSNIQSLGFNTTTQLTILFINSTAFDNSSIIRSGNTSWIKSNQYTYNNLSLSDIVAGVGNATAVNASLQTEISARGSLGNWSADKSGYINSTQLDNTTILRSSSGLINTTQLDNSTIVRSLSGYFNSYLNFTTYLTGGKLCTWNSSALKMECLTTMTIDTNDTSRVDSLNSTLISANSNITSEILNRGTNDTALGNRIDSVNSTAVGKASPGTCGSGQVVMNTTTSGVQCASLTVDTNDTSRVDSLNSTLISANGNITLETSNRQTNDTLYNNSMKSYVDTQDALTDTCSEISGCVVGAVSLSTIYTNLSLGVTANGFYANASSYPAVSSALYTNITQAQGYYSNASSYPGVKSALYTNITQAQGYYANASNGNIAYGWGYYGSNLTLINSGNTTWPASAAATANGNWTLDKTSYFSKTDSYTNLSQGGTAYSWGDYRANGTIISSANTSWPITTFTGASAVNVNLTGKNLTFSNLIPDQDTVNHAIYDNTSCIVLKAGTTILEVCE